MKRSHRCALLHGLARHAHVKITVPRHSHPEQSAPGGFGDKQMPMPPPPDPHAGQTSRVQLAPPITSQTPVMSQPGICSSSPPVPGGSSAREELVGSNTKPRTSNVTAKEQLITRMQLAKKQDISTSEKRPTLGDKALVTTCLQCWRQAPICIPIQRGPQ